MFNKFYKKNFNRFTKKDSTISSKRSVDVARKTKNKTLWKKLSRIILAFMLALFFISCAGVIIGLYYVAKFTNDLPDITDPAFLNPVNTENSVMYDRNGKTLYKFIGDTNRVLIDNFDEVPLMLRYAFIVSEDADFYNHQGVDFTALLRCGFGAISGSVSCGGSTITQQSIKNTVLLEESLDTSVDQKQRKIREILLALKLETVYTKDEILKFYLNLAPQGGNVNGVKTAAKLYFGKEMKDLSLAESAMLAGLTQNPNKFNPYSTSDDVYCRKDGVQVSNSDVVIPAVVEGVEPSNVLKDIDGIEVIRVRPYKCRQLYVLNNFAINIDKVKLAGVEITNESIEAARNEELVILPNVENIKAPHFVFYAKDQLLNVDSKLINDKPLTLEELYKKGYKIYTTVDLDLQQDAEKIIKDWVDGSEEWCSQETDSSCYLKKKGVKERFGLYNASLASIDTKTGEILTMVGSKDYFGQEEALDPETGLSKFSPKVNIMTSLQQPGSSIKPIGLLSGFESGKIAPTTVIPDISLKDVFGKGYDPQNAENWTGNGLYFANGPVSEKNFISYSMQKSLNRPMLLAADAVGVEAVLNTYEKMGYSTFSENRDKYGVAVMIGAGEIYPIEHVNAFAVMANGGVDYHEYNALLRIEDSKGNVLWRRESEKLMNKVLDEKAAYLMSKTLYKYSELQTSFSSAVSEWPNYGKTGTSDDNKDTWYMVYTPHISVGMWVGNNDNSVPFAENGRLAYGSNAAMPALEKYLEKILPRYPKDKIEAPPGIVKAKVCVVSGKLANEKCGTSVVEGEFIQGKLPPVDDTYTSALMCYDKPLTDPSAKSKNMIARKVDEQYGYAKDSNYRYLKALNPLRQEVYDKAIGQKPLNTSAFCDNDYSTVTQNPFVSIVSPLNGATYIAGSTISLGGSSSGVLGGIVDFKVYFDGSVIASSSNETMNKQYQIPASISPGSHTITFTATDLGGRSTSSSITISVSKQSSSSTSTIGLPSGGSQQGNLILNSNTSEISSGNTTTLSANYTGNLNASSVSMAVMYPGTSSYANIGNMVEVGNDKYNLTWQAPTTTGTYLFRAIFTSNGGNSVVIYSNILNITVK
jgi:membrane peptidoglycan carboxypeptidase